MDYSPYAFVFLSYYTTLMIKVNNGTFTSLFPTYITYATISTMQAIIYSSKPFILCVLSEKTDVVEMNGFISALAYQAYLENI